MVEHHGWQVPRAFGSAEDEAARVKEAVGVSDVGWMVKLDLKGAALQVPPAWEEASFWCLGRLHYLLTCEPAAADSVAGRLRQIQSARTDSSASLPIYATDVTSVYTHLWLAGPRSREVLNKLTSLNLSDGTLRDQTCAQASVAHVRAIVLRQDVNEIPAYHLLVGREYGESVWESVLHAGYEFHIAPFGLEARRLLHG